MAAVVGNEHREPSSNLDKAVCNSHMTNIPEKRINLTTLLLAMGNRRVDWAIFYGNRSRKRKILNSNLLNST